MLVAERAAAPLLPNLSARDPNGPGQFAFADPRRVERLLADSGWADAAIRSIDVGCRFPADALVHWFTRLGPLGRVLDATDARTRSHVIESVRSAYDAYVHGNEIRFDAASWLVVAHSAPRSGGAHE
jgi:hypothetical protein